MNIEMKLVYERAWNFHNTTGIDVEELISVALISYVEATKKFNASFNTTPITFCYRAITNALIDYCRKKRVKHIPLKTEILTSIADNSKTAMMNLDINRTQFSERIQKMISIIFDNADLFDLDHPKKNKILLRKLLSEYGWRSTHITEAISGMKQILSKTPENYLFF